MRGLFSPLGWTPPCLQPPCTPRASCGPAGPRSGVLGEGGLQLGAIPSEGSICHSYPQRRPFRGRELRTNASRRDGSTRGAQIFPHFGPEGSLPSPSTRMAEPSCSCPFSARRRKRWTLWGVRGCPGALGCSPAFYKEEREVPGLGHSRRPAVPQGEGRHGCGCRRSPPQRGHRLAQPGGRRDRDNARGSAGEPHLETPTGPHSPASERG